MATPYLGEIRMFGGDFAPSGWALCNGQELAAADYPDLYVVLGTTFGGNATSFNVPDLRGRIPVGQLNGPGLTPRTIGQSGGAETVNVESDGMPGHTHTLRANPGDGNAFSPAGTVVAKNKAGLPAYADNVGANAVSLRSDAVTASAGGEAHDNMGPFGVVNFIIALVGLDPLSD